MIRRTLIAGAALLSCALSAPAPAGAAALVGKGPVQLKGAQAALVHDGGWTSMTLAFDVRDAPDEVVLLVPLPKAPALVARGDKAALTELDRASTARVVELWEQDPCEVRSLIEPADGDVAPPPAALPLIAPSATATSGSDNPPQILMELTKDGFRFPGGLLGTLESAPHLARVALTKQELATSSFTFVFESPALSVPTRAFASAHEGAALTMFVLSPRGRFEATAGENLVLPTNVDVTADALENRRGLLSALEGQLAKKAVLTEYAWSAASCELCGPPLGVDVLRALGAPSMPFGRGSSAEVMVLADKVSPDEPGGPDELRAALTRCYRTELGKDATLAGEVVVDVTVKGDATTSTVANGPAALGSCATSALAGVGFDASGELRLVFAPVSRKTFSDTVVTRLVTRFTGVPETDLALRPAKAITGGRELAGETPPGVSFSESGNNFQARYIVRHPWKGAVACSAPKRGSWGGPPSGASKRPAAVTKPKTADLKKLLVAKLPTTEALRIRYEAPPPAPAPAPPDAVPEPATPSSAPSAASAKPGPSSDAPRGCGCVVGAASSAPVAGWLSLALAFALARRRVRG